MNEILQRAYDRKDDNEEEYTKQTRHELTQVLALPGYSSAANCS
jgi:hypothetical protein